LVQWGIFHADVPNSLTSISQQGVTQQAGFIFSQLASPYGYWLGFRSGDQQRYSYATDGVVPLPQVVDPQHLEEVVALVDH
jgi:hypothetical protein